MMASHKSVLPVNVVSLPKPSKMASAPATLTRIRRPITQQQPATAVVKPAPTHRATRKHRARNEMKNNVMRAVVLFEPKTRTSDAPANVKQKSLPFAEPCQ